MANVLLIILLIVSVILTGLILIQRSEGGALGIGGGGGGGGMMSGRGTADLVTRMTGIFGVIFMVICVLISISFNYQQREASLLNADEATQEMVPGTSGTPDNKTDAAPLPDASDSAKDDSPLADETSAPETDEPSDTEPQK